MISSVLVHEIIKGFPSIVGASSKVVGVDSGGVLY
jgi:hypothetical protein